MKHKLFLLHPLTRLVILLNYLIFLLQKFGFIKFGSRVDVFLPLDSKILVKEGDVVKGAKTVLAERS